jgi:hypothetical protein
LPPLAASTEGDHGRESLSEKKEDTDRVARSTVDVQFEGEGNVEGESKSKGENDTALGHSDQAPLKKLSPISVTVDLSAIDRLFPSVKLAKPSPEPVPDVIIDDTFASTSERKAWYRLSRRGPMRMHDLGDEENFVRMDWKSSNVRHDTLVIVRRWMEEDSIAGRVVLGRRGGDEPGSKLFNWDSSAPQVEIGDLLGKKTRKSKEHSRQGSRTSIGSPISPTAATFAWSSPPASPVASVQSPVAPSTVVKPTQPPVDRPKSIFIPPPPAIGRPVSIDQALKRPVAPPITPLGAPQDSTDEEEDDWGEMVASPGHDQRTSLDTAPSAANGLISPVSTASEGKSPTLSHNGANGIINSAKGQSVANAAGFGSLDLLMGGHKKRSQEGQPGQTSNPFPAQRLLSHKRSQSEMVSTPPSLLRADADTKPSTLKAAAHSKADEDEIVAGILADLPDLTYMLRR